MDPIAIITIICAPLAAFGAYIGIRQIVQWRRDVKNNSELQDRVESLTKKIDGIAVYLDGLPETPNKQRRSLFSAGLGAMDEYKYEEAIRHFRECLVSATEQSEKVALLNLIGICFYSVSRINEA
ncbi:unnamed protein product, partial [marine sediment metagenome]